MMTTYPLISRKRIKCDPKKPGYNVDQDADKNDPVIVTTKQVIITGRAMVSLRRARENDSKNVEENPFKSEC